MPVWLVKVVTTNWRVLIEKRWVGISYLGTRTVGWGEKKASEGHEPRSIPSASGIIGKGSPWTARIRVAAQFVGLFGLVWSTDYLGITDGLIRANVCFIKTTVEIQNEVVELED